MATNATGTGTREAGRRASAVRAVVPPDATDPVGSTLDDLHQVATALRQHVEHTVLRREDLTWTAFTILRLVWTGKRVETRRAAAAAGIAKATLTGVADTLVSRDLMRRLEHPRDRRLVLLELTTPGRRLVRRLLPAVQAEESFALAPLTSTQLTQLGDLLGRVAAHMRSDEARLRRH